MCLPYLVYLPARGISIEPYASLFRRPIKPIDQASTICGVGDVILADMSQYMPFERAGAKFGVAARGAFSPNDSSVGALRPIRVAVLEHMDNPKPLGGRVRS